MRLSLPVLSILAIGACALVAAFSSPAASAPPGPADELGLHQLRSDFHLAGSSGDVDLLRSLWADDAVFNAAGNSYEGPDEIVDFLTNNPNFGNAVNLTSEAKASWVLKGKTAEYAFECIIVNTGAGSDPLYTSLSSIPPGSQNPSVEIVQHSHSKGIAVRQANRWVFQEFNGAPGPIPAP